MRTRRERRKVEPLILRREDRREPSLRVLVRAECLDVVLARDSPVGIRFQREERSPIHDTPDVVTQQLTAGCPHAERDVQHTSRLLPRDQPIPIQVPINKPRRCQPTDLSRHVRRFELLRRQRVVSILIPSRPLLRQPSQRSLRQRNHRISQLSTQFLRLPNRHRDKLRLSHLPITIKIKDLELPQQHGPLAPHPFQILRLGEHPIAVRIARLELSDDRILGQ